MTALWLLAWSLAAPPSRLPFDPGEDAGDDAGDGTTEELAPANQRAMLLGRAAESRRSVTSAIRLYEQQVAKAPGAPAPAVALARALAKSGRCEEALDHFWPWVGTTPFGVEAALAASGCSSRLGFPYDAIYFDEVALALDPSSARALTALAVDAAEVLDQARLTYALDALAYDDPEAGDRSVYARALLALRTGDIDTFDDLLFRWRAEGRRGGEMMRLSAQLWLDLDDPATALEVLGDQRNGSGVRALRAEAFRRLGLAAEAEAVLRGTPRGQPTGILADAVRVRTLVDLGRLREAAEVLDAWEGAVDPEIHASRWYLARARGEALAPLAEAYAAVERSPLRTLDRLVPLR